MDRLSLSSSPDVLGGTLVFAGTRVPVQTFVDYLAGGDTIDAFLLDFPSVTRQQLEAFLGRAVELAVAEAARVPNP